MNTFEQFGFTDPTNNILESSVLNNPSNSIWGDVLNGLSGYAIGQFTGIVAAGEYTRRQNQNNQQVSLEVKKELFKRELLFKRKMAKDEADYILESARLGIIRQQELALKELDNIQAQDKFNDFCQEWNKHYNVQVKTILGELKRISSLNEGECLKPKLLIARTGLFADLAKKEPSLTSERDMYLFFCSEIHDRLNNDSVDLSWIDFWKGMSVSPISDTLNIHYITQGIPTIIVFPVLRNDSLSIRISVWFTGKGLTNIFLSRFIEINTSYNLKNQLVSSIAGVICYASIVFNSFFLQRGKSASETPNNILQAIDLEPNTSVAIHSQLDRINTFINENSNFFLI